MFRNHNRIAAVLFVLLTSYCCCINGQSVVTADFSIQTGTPLIKTKFNVYQTPLAPMNRLRRDMPLLAELNIRSLRFESAWGKHIDFNAPSISGTYPDFKYNYEDYDRFLKGVVAQNVNPLLTVGYNPAPLNIGTDSRNKPNDMQAWHKISKDFAAHWKQIGIKPIDYEIWNEPDLHIFFNGTKADYFDIYKAGSTGVKLGDADAKVGGPVTAFAKWYKDFLAFVKVNELPLDFISGHAYANATEQLDSMRSALGASGWPRVETYLTEYASYTTSPNTDIAEGGAQERFVAAADFLKDAKMFLSYTELTKVYWAQWLDVELLSKQGKWYYNKGTDKMGLVDLSGNRKALFNGFKIYNMMPVDRNKVTLNGSADAMASSDAHNAALVIWNNAQTETNVVVNLHKLPFRKGTANIYRIDEGHSSYYENNASDSLEMVESVELSAGTFTWKGKLPGKGVIYFKLSDKSAISKLEKNAVAKHTRTHHWFQDRGNNNYADFDNHTWIARLGMGSQKDTALSQIGIEMMDVPSIIRIQTDTYGGPRSVNSRSFLGYRLDFVDKNQKYVKSILFHGGLYNKKRKVALPWAKGGIADEVHFVSIKNASLEIAKLAPPDFEGKLMLSFIQQDTGRNSGAKFKLYANTEASL